MGVLRPITTSAAALAAMLLGFAISAQAQYFSPNPIQYRIAQWRTVESSHFVVHYQSDHDSLAFRVLELAEGAHRSLSRRLGFGLSRRVPIVVHASRNGALQTNVRPEISEIGTGDFARILRNRMLVTFTGSYEELRRALVHELVHAMLFDHFGGGTPTAWLGLRDALPLPPWFVEGLAEYLALGFDLETAVVIRDGAIENHLPPLKAGAGYLTYKLGQAAIAWLVEHHGEAAVRELLASASKSGNFEQAFRQAVGTPVGEFEQQWREALRKRWWPAVARTENADQFARRLTDYGRDEIALKSSPAISPQGDRIAYYSSRRQFTDVRLISSFDGKFLRRLTRTQRLRAFEFVPSLRGGIAWSPDGERIAIAGSKGDQDVLEIRSPRNGKVLARHRLPFESPAYPAWSPDGDSIAVTGTLAGQSDIWMIPVRGGTPRRLTNDVWDEKDLTWFPLGRRLTFASDRVAPLALDADRAPDGFGRYAIYTLELERGTIEHTVDTGGDDHSPAWSPNGRRLAFISGIEGTSDIQLFDLDSGRRLRLTRVRGGIQALSWAHDNDRLVFSAYDHGGFDIFALREALSRDEVVEHLHARAMEDSTSMPEPKTRSAGSSEIEARGEEPEQPLGSSDGLGAASAPVAPPEAILDQHPRRYRARFRPEVFGGGVHAARGFGFVGDVQLTLTDVVGERAFHAAVDLVNESFSDLNALVAYRSLRRRWDLGLGAFHFGRFLSSRVTTMAEQFDAPRLYSEEVYGGFLSFQYPLNRFHRFELLPTVMFVERDRVMDDGSGGLATEHQRLSVFSPVVSFVRDDALFGFYGPVSGSRLNLTYGPSFALLPDPLEYQTVTFDSRHYQALNSRLTLAVRLLGGVSEGRDAQTFRMGGYGSLRGYPEFELLGSRVAIVNTELRFPFVQDLGILGPVSIGGLRAGGAAFVDVGMVWDKDDPIRVTEFEGGSRSLKDLKVGFGAGARTGLLFVILKADVAWATDLSETSRPRWHISLGPEF